MASKQYMSPHDRGMTGGMGSMANNPGPGELEGDGGDSYQEDGPPAPADSEGAQTATIPMALLGGKEFKPGEEVIMKVVSMDKENGTVEIAYSTGEEKEPMGETEHPALAAMPGE